MTQSRLYTVSGFVWAPAVAEERQSVQTKWRPPLALVLSGSLFAVLVLPVFGFFVVDALSPPMGRVSAILTVALGALSATVILGWLLWRLILSPVRSLATRAEIIRSGGATTPMTRFGTPEIGELGQAVLDMAEVLQARELAVRSYADHVSHELKTPLTAIRGAAELLASEPGMTEETRRLVGTITEAEARAESLLAAAREIAAARAPDHHGQTNLDDIAPLPEHSGLKVLINGGNVSLPLASKGLRIILAHLIENAAEAGATTIRIQAEKSAEGPTLSIIDDGPGISQGNRDRVFDPFFTTRRDTGGTGMGLAIVQTLLLAHGAEVSVDPAGQGASFRIRF
ncbi:MAG: HAMP domain-containing sensor histidine kinase [Boseongicola sp.]